REPMLGRKAVIRYEDLRIEPVAQPHRAVPVRGRRPEDERAAVEMHDDGARRIGGTHRLEPEGPQAMIVEDDARVLLHHRFAAHLAEALEASTQRLWRRTCAEQRAREEPVGLQGDPALQRLSMRRAWWSGVRYAGIGRQGMIGHGVLHSGRVDA